MNFFKKTFATLISFLLFFSITPYILAFSTDMSHEHEFNVVVINSYNNSSKWESFVSEGIENNLKNQPVNISYEYLDIKKRNDAEYLTSYIELLNLKYSNNKVDAFITIDDEAFDIARENLYNENSIFYKRPIIFTGVNNAITLSLDEANYITGAIEAEDNIELVNMILRIHDNVDEINLILDNAAYSNSVINDFNVLLGYFIKPIKINYIQSSYLEDIIDILEQNPNPNQANIIVGDFLSSDGHEISTLNDIVNKIKQATNAPLYTKVQPYIFAGALGGIVDWGQCYGETIANIIIRILNGEKVSNITPILDIAEKVVFDYESLFKYGINPLELPENSIYINKGAFDLLLPMPLIILFWSSIILFIALFIYLIIKIIIHKRDLKKNKFLYQQAQKSEKLKTEFIATVSHELRTPVNIILNTSKLLRFKLNNNIFDKDDCLLKLNYIDQNSQRLLRLVNNILDLTKIQTGFINANLRIENIVEVVEDTALSIVPFAESNKIEVVFDTEEEEILTAIDSIKLERALLNILSNSIKFTKNGGRIDINVWLEENIVNISVSDSGIGISKEDLNHVFDKFNQVDSSFCREQEGSGLGLSIAKGLIEIQNGVISVSSVLGEGTTFVISLPINLQEDIKDDTYLDNADLQNTVDIELSDIKKDDI